MKISIIGSGLGGLAAGAYLAKQGFEVHIFERLNQVGGYVHTFSRGGYTFEASTHQLNGFDLDNCFGETIKALGIDRRLTIKKQPDAFELLLFDDAAIVRRFLIHAGYENAFKDLTNYFPDHKDETKMILDECRGTARDLLRVKRLRQPNPHHRPVDLLTLMLLKQSSRSVIAKTIGTRSWEYLVKYKERPYDNIAAIATDKTLKLIFSQLCHYVGADPKTVPAYVPAMITNLIMLEGPVSIVGGTGSLLRSLVDVIYENGGRIHFKSRVTGVEIRGRRVQSLVIDGDKQVPTDIVIANGSAYDTYKNIVGLDNINDDKLRSKILAYEPSLSVFQVYIGLPFDPAQYGLPTATMILNPAENLDFPYSEQPQPGDRTPFIMTNLSVANPEFNPGENTSIIITEYDRRDRWRDLSDIQYQKQKQATQTVILNKAKRVTPIPFDKADIVFSGTPRTMSHYSADEFGGIVGAKFIPAQTSVNRFDYQGPFENFYLVGADSRSSAGVGNCLDSGVVVGRMITKRR